jgi:mannose-1-phosphate guanylyltransferase
MQIILLCGGSGKRLWPLSNGTRSKQFLRLLPTGIGVTESMVQRVVRQINESDIEGNIIIATSESQSEALLNQLGDDIELVTEPTRRDTFPAIALATSYLSKSKAIDNDEVVVVMPCDPYTDANYFQTILKMAAAVKNNVADLVLMGIQPTSPSSKFGYIVPKQSDPLYVERFTEKPSEAVAAELIQAGALWNGGVFAFKLGYLNDIVARYSNYDNFSSVREHYNDFPKISFDYEVAEKANSIAVIPFNGLWKDLGTWDALANELSQRDLGNVISAECENTTAINELNIPLVCYGTKNLIVAASPDGILVTDKSQSDKIKSTVDQIASRPMFEERRWGQYSVLDNHEYTDGFSSLTKTLTLNAGCSISYQRHKHRSEVWTFVDGEGVATIDGESICVKRGDVINIKQNQLHALKAISSLTFIEVQFGEFLSEDDIERVKDDNIFV